MNPNLTSVDVLVNSIYGAEQTNSHIEFTDLPVKFSRSQIVLCCTANSEGEKTEVCKF